MRSRHRLARDAAPLAPGHGRRRPGRVHRRGAPHRGAAGRRYELVAAAPSSQRRARGGQRRGTAPRAGARATPTIREMARAEAARDDGIDVVAIVTPNHLHCADRHAPSSKPASHVICDKPLTTTCADGETLVALAREKRCLFALTHNYTGYPMVRAGARAWSPPARWARCAWCRSSTRRTGSPSRLEASGRPAGVVAHRPRAGRRRRLPGRHRHRTPRTWPNSSAASRRARSAPSCTPSCRAARSTTTCRCSCATPTVRAACCGPARWRRGDENGLRLRVYGSRGRPALAAGAAERAVVQPLGLPARRLTPRHAPTLPARRRAATRHAGRPPGRLHRSVRAAVPRLRRRRAPTPARRAGRPAARAGLDAGVRSLAFIEAVLHSHRENGAWVVLR